MSEEYKRNIITLDEILGVSSHFRQGPLGGVQPYMSHIEGHPEKKVAIYDFGRSFAQGTGEKLADAIDAVLISNRLLPDGQHAVMFSSQQNRLIFSPQFFEDEGALGQLEHFHK